MRRWAPLVVLLALAFAAVPAAAADLASPDMSKAAGEDLDCTLLIAPPLADADAWRRAPAALAGSLELAAAHRADAPAGPPVRRPVRMGSCAGVRPGAAVYTDLGGCSLNFMFRGWDPKLEHPPIRTFIATAGHCILASSGDYVWAQGTGPVARDGGNREIGRFVYARLGSVRDFALIEVAAGVEVNPQMCHWGGPTGLETRTGAGPMWIEHSGQGIVVRSTFPGRTHIARTFSNPDTVNFDGVATQGDSGSGIVSEDHGRALGVVVSVGPNTDGPIRATRVAPQIAEASARTGLVFQLITAARL